MKKINFISADFETTNSNKNPQVYSWGAMSENGNYNDGISISSFFDYVRNIDNDSIIYFHNGSRFDYHFVVAALNKNGFKQYITEYTKTGKVFKKSPYRLSMGQEKRKFLNENEYSLLVDGNHKIMEIKIGLKSNKLKGSRVVIFRDSWLLWGSSIAYMGKTLNKVFSSTKYTKMDIGTNYSRKSLYKSEKEFHEDGNERAYLKQDCFILLEYLKLMDKSFPRKYWKITNASTAYNVWKYNFFGKELLENAVKEGTVDMMLKSNGIPFYKIGAKFYTSKRIKDKLISKYLPTHGIPLDMFNWYYGGLTGSNPQARGLVIPGVNCYDLNSSYPSQMKYKMLPYGTIFKGDNKNCDWKYYIITITKKTVNESGLPFIQVLNKSGRSPYSKVLPVGYVLYLTTPDYKNFQIYYKGKWDAKVVYSQKTIPGEFMFGSFVDFYYKQKQENKESNYAMFAVSKLMLNSVYGKFGSKRLRTSRIWNDSTGMWEKEEILEKSKFFLPFAIAITTYGRMELVEATGNNFDRVICYDTDSLFIIGDKLNFKEDDNKLGYWKKENTHGPLHGLTRRSKQYLFYDDSDNMKIAFAGINFTKNKNKPTFENFITGTFIMKQLRPKRLPSGVFLEEIEKGKEIKPIWDKDYMKADKGLDLWYSDKESYMNGYKEQLKKFIDKK